MNLSDMTPRLQAFIEELLSPPLTSRQERDNIEKMLRGRLPSINLTPKWSDGNQSYSRREEVNLVMGIERLLEDAIELQIRLEQDYPEGEGLQIAQGLFAQAKDISTPGDNSY
jgi:hypothetical protein